MTLNGAPYYDTAKDLQEGVDRYFKEHIEKLKNLPNIEGLSWFLGFAGREEFGKQDRRGADFAHIVNHTRSKMADMKLSLAATGKLNPTIVIFELINNHNYINNRSDNTNNNKNEEQSFNVTLTVRDKVE